MLVTLPPHLDIALPSFSPGPSQLLTESEFHPMKIVISPNNGLTGKTSNVGPEKTDEQRDPFEFGAGVDLGVAWISVRPRAWIVF